MQGSRASRLLADLLGGIVECGLVLAGASCSRLVRHMASRAFAAASSRRQSCSASHVALRLKRDAAQERAHRTIGSLGKMGGDCDEIVDAIGTHKDMCALASTASVASSSRLRTKMRHASPTRAAFPPDIGDQYPHVVDCVPISC